MRVKAIARSDASGPAARDKSSELHRLPRNVSNAALHPLPAAREYQRAIVAAKLDRLLAKPFVAALSGHHDGIYSLAVPSPTTNASSSTLSSLAYSGAADGEIRAWCLASQRCVRTLPRAHEGFVRALCPVAPSVVRSEINCNTLLSCGTDKVIRHWSMLPSDDSTGKGASPLLATFTSSQGLNSISHHASQSIFATGGIDVMVWDHNRSTPVSTFEWGAGGDSVNCVRFNPSETSVLASTGSDRSISLYDLRTNTPLRKVVLSMTSNGLCWNPMEPFNFCVANEDHNVYTFDMRNLSSATNVLRDHVSAVLDVDYAPTGASIVSGGYDRSIRIFDVRPQQQGGGAPMGHSRDVYHLKRMQRVFAVKYSPDAKYIVAASDDANLRVWRASASAKPGALTAREEASLAARSAVLAKHAHLPAVRRIASHRIVPRALANASKLKSTMLETQRRKRENIRKSVPGAAAERPVPERKQSIIGVQI